MVTNIRHKRLLSTFVICGLRAHRQERHRKSLKIRQEKSGGKTAAEFGWDTSKLQKITLFQAHSAPLQRTTVRHHLSRKRANFCFLSKPHFLGGLVLSDSCPFGQDQDIFAFQNAKIAKCDYISLHFAKTLQQGSKTRRSS